MKIQTLDQPLIRSLIEAARESPRRRTNHNFHQSYDENPHRFLNVMLRDSYFTPHRHAQPPKHESFLVLQGEVGFLTFDETGKVLQAYRLSPEGLHGREGYVGGIDIPPGVWHTLVVLSDVAVCYEVKPGPYDPNADKELADWAPAEGDEGTLAVMENWRGYF